MLGAIEIDDELEVVRWAAEAPDWTGVNTPMEQWLTLDHEDPEMMKAMHPRNRIINRAHSVTVALNMINWDRPVPAKAVASALSPLGSNAWPQAILNFWYLFERETALDALREIMPHAHGGWNLAIGGPNIVRDDWLNVWRHAAYVTDDLPKPNGPITLYRGGCARDGVWLDWSTNLEAAIWFAKFSHNGGMSQEPAVYRINARPDMVLGRLEGRGESEVIIDYKLLHEWEDIKPWRTIPKAKP